MKKHRSHYYLTSFFYVKNKEVIIISIFDGLTAVINQTRSIGNYVSITEPVRITNGIAQLREVPDRAAGITLLNGATPLSNNDFTQGQLPSAGVISVDFDQGYIYADPTLEGATITCGYQGKGGLFLNASRIATKLVGTTVTQTLDSVVSAASQFTFLGVYSNSTTYLKYNVISYQGASYACTATTSLGNLPTSTSYFTKIAGTIFRNTYNSGTTYAVSDYVVNVTGDALYVSIVDGNVGQSLTDTTKWLPTISFLSVTSAENSRSAAESGRVSAESGRTSAESTRVGSESTRISNENTRISQETSRQTNTTTAITNLNNTASALVSRGTYSSSTNYSINNVVFYQGVSYMCIIAGTGNTPSASSTFWNRMTGFSNQGQWNSGITYSVTQVVYDSVNQNLYMSLVDNNLNNALSDTSKWQLLITVSSIVSTLNTTNSNVNTAEGLRSTAETNRSSAETARNNSESTRSTSETTRQTNETSRINRDTAYQLIEAYNAAHNYVPLNKVTYNGSTYQNILASTNNIPTNTTYWILVAAAGANGAGTVASITSTDASIAVGGTASTPDLSVQTGTSANKIPKRDANGNIPNSGLQITSKSANATLLLTESGIIDVTTAASTITITLPSAVTTQLSYIIKKVDSGAGSITIATTSSQLIDGASTKSITYQYGYIQVVSDGTGWQIVDGSTNITSANADISISNGTNNPVLTLNSGAGANQIVKRDGSGNINATTVTTNANLTGMVTSIGNATTVVTNANLTGDVTSVGNATTIKSNVALAGSPTTTTQSPNDNSNKVSTTAYADAGDALKANSASPTFTGTTTVSTLNHARAIDSQPQIKDYSETVTTDAAVSTTKTLDISTGNVFDLTLTGNVTLTLSNPAPSGQSCSITLLVRQGGTAFTITYPTSVKWGFDIIPDISAINKTSVLTFMTVNGGTRWYGFLSASGLVT